MPEEYEDPGDERMAYSCFWGSYDHCRLCRSKVVLFNQSINCSLYCLYINLLFTIFPWYLTCTFCIKSSNIYLLCGKFTWETKLQFNIRSLHFYGFLFLVVIWVLILSTEMLIILQDPIIWIMFLDHSGGKFTFKTS